MAPHNLYQLRPDELNGQCALNRVVFDIAAAKTHRDRPASGSAEPVPHELTLKMPGSGEQAAPCEIALRPESSLFSPTIPLTPFGLSGATIVHSSAPADFLPSPQSAPASVPASSPMGGAVPPGPFANVGHPLHPLPAAPRINRDIAASPFA